MHTTGAIVFGFVIGLLFSAVLMLGTLAKYVASDMDGFRRWLDSREVSP